MVSKETKLLHRSMFLEWERELYADRDPFTNLSRFLFVPQQGKHITEQAQSYVEPEDKK